MKTVIFNKELFKQGYYSDVNFYNRILSPAEIRYIKSVGYDYVFFLNEEGLIHLGHKDLVHILNISKSVTIKQK